MDPTGLLLLIQVIVLAVLLGVVVFFILADRKKKPVPSALDDLRDVIQQTQDLSGNFQEQIQIKVELVNRVLTELDDKIREARLVMEGLEKTYISARQAKTTASVNR